MNAVEPVGGRRQSETGGACLNCGAAVLGDYCSRCGQKAQLPRSLSAFFTDFAASLLNFEGKFWRTLPMLAWCPGDLTRRYVDGQRVRFLSPIGLYLFTVFLMFAVLGLSGSLTDIRVDESITNSIAAEQGKQQRIERELATQPPGTPTRAALQRQLEQSRSDLQAMRKIEAGQVPIIMDEGDSMPPWLRDPVQKAAADPKGTMTKVQQAASAYSWLLIPLSVPVLRLLFPFRRRRLYDHTVFVTYSLSFMMLLVVAGGLLALAGAGSVIPWLSLLPPWHMYRQLKGAYRLSRTGALVRTAFLLFASLLVLTLWAMLVIAIGALT